MKTKALLGALVVAVLAVFGVIGLRNAPDANAGNTAGATAFNPSTVLVGGSASSTLTFYDDTSGTITASTGTPNLIITASATALSSNAAISCAAAAGPAGLGTQTATLTDAACDADAISQQWTWTITVTCIGAAGNYTLTWAPTGNGSIINGTSASNAQPIACVSTATTGTNTISIRKVDQFGQPQYSSFSIQQGPFWVEVARVNLGATTAQNPCATDGTGGASCSLVGVITPNTFPNGLPAGTYRIVEVLGSGGGLGSSGYCTLVGVYNGFSYTTGASGAVNSTFWGSPLVQPYQITLPDANPLDLQLTFVNSCIVPGGPSAATSGIAVVIGGSTPGLTNSANLETNPAPGSDSNARLDIRIRDNGSIPIQNAHVTVLIDKGTLAMRRDLSNFPNGGYEVIEPVPYTNYGSAFSGDTCDQATSGWWTQSTTNGNYTWPYLTASRQQQDGYTNIDGIISACVYVDNTLAPNTTPGKINVQAIIEGPTQGGLYNGSAYYNPLYPNNLSLPNYLAAPNIVLTATITVVGPPASITVAAAPTSLNCGEKATITVTVKDSAGQNVSDHTRVELVTNFGGVIGGTTATLGPVNVTGGQVFPQSSSSAETFNGVATAYLLTSTDHVGPYEVVAAAGGSVLATNGALAPWYGTSGLLTTNAATPTASAYFPWYAQGLLQYSPSSAPVNAQATVTCAVPGAPAAAAPAIAAPRTGQGPADAFAIRPPNTGDAGLAATSGSNAAAYVAAGLAVFALAGLASLKFATRR